MLYQLPWIFSLIRMLTYLIVQVLKCECDKFALRDTCNWKVKPCLVIVTLSIRLSISTYPQIITVLLESSLSSCKITRTELTAKYYFWVRNLPSCSLRECVKSGLVIYRLKWWYFNCLRIKFFCTLVVMTLII